MLIPLNEVFIYPIFHRYTPSIKRHWKVYFGMTLLIVRCVVLVTLLTVFRKSFLDLNEPFVNATPPCTTLFQESFHNNSYTYGVYSSVPELLSAISYVLIIIGITEFLCAQVPYSMTGRVDGWNILWLTGTIPCTEQRHFCPQLSFMELWNCVHLWILVPND